MGSETLRQTVNLQIESIRSEQTFTVACSSRVDCSILIERIFLGQRLRLEPPWVLSVSPIDD